MGDRATVTFHTSPETKARLEQLASLTRRSKSYLSNEALERYLAEEEEFINAVNEGMEDARAGRVMSGENLRSTLHAHIDRLAKPPKNA